MLMCALRAFDHALAHVPSFSFLKGFWRDGCRGAVRRLSEFVRPFCARRIRRHREVSKPHVLRSCRTWEVLQVELLRSFSQDLVLFSWRSRALASVKISGGVLWIGSAWRHGRVRLRIFYSRSQGASALKSHRAHLCGASKLHSG